MTDLHTAVICVALAGLIASFAIEWVKSRRDSEMWEEHLRRLSDDSI